MEQLLCHLAGDYLLQTTKMATLKQSSWKWAIVHGIAYTSVFLLLTDDWWKLLIIGGTHVVIDHYRLAGVWARLVNWDWRNPQPILPPWVLLAIDQSCHLLINYLTLRA